MSPAWAPSSSMRSVSTHFNDTTDSFGFTSEGVEDGGSFFEFAGVDTGESKGSILVVHDLEGKRTEWAVRSDDSKFTSLVTFWINLRLWQELQ